MREWDLDQLFAMFPDVVRGTDRVLRCLWRASGEGRCIREAGGRRRWASVALTARPASRFTVRLAHRWPEPLNAVDEAAAESRLLRGILEGTVKCEDPPWRCALVCSSVEWRGEGVGLIGAAASLAVLDLVQGGGWEPAGSPGDHVA